MTDLGGTAGADAQRATGRPRATAAPASPPEADPADAPAFPEAPRMADPPHPATSRVATSAASPAATSSAAPAGADLSPAAAPPAAPSNAAASPAAAAPAAPPAPAGAASARRSFPAGAAATGLLWLVVLVLCVVPLGLVAAISFGQKIEGAGWEWAFTLENYRRFFVGASWPEETTDLYRMQLYWSLRYAVTASVLAVVTALPFTYLLTRLSRRAQARWLVFLLASLSLSEVFIVMGWDILLSNNSGLPALFAVTGLTDWLKATGWFEVLRDWGLANPRNVKFKTSEVATVLTMSYLVWPYAVILLYPALSRLDPALAEAARTMGARPWTVARTVILPAVRLPLMGTVLLLFVFLLGSYVVVTVFADPARHTTAVSVYEHVRGSTLNAPFGATQSMILLVTAAAFLVLGQRLSRRAGGDA